MKVRYLGPAVTLNGKDVPAGGLDVNLDEAVVQRMAASGHRFADAGLTPVEQPTPQEANAGESGKAQAQKK